MIFDKEGYPCSGHECYDKDNYHVGCGSCPYRYNADNPPKDKKENK